MKELKFIFEVDGVRVETKFTYVEEPTKQQIYDDIKNWFFDYHYMWFAVEENGIETNLEDY